MKLLNILFIVLLTFLSCKKISHEGKFILVAYEINKPSRVWIQNITTKKIDEITISKNRKVLDINLNDTLILKYTKNYGYTLLNNKLDTIKTKTPNDSLNIITSLENYYDFKFKYKSR